MHKDDSCNSGNAFTFLTGAILGATAALLLAPRSGRETREKLRDFGEEMYEKADYLPDDLKEHGAAIADRGREMIERGRELINRGTGMIDEGKDFLDEKKQALNDAIEAGREAMKRERKTLADTMDEEE